MNLYYMYFDFSDQDCCVFANFSDYIWEFTKGKIITDYKGIIATTSKKGSTITDYHCIILNVPAINEKYIDIFKSMEEDVQLFPVILADYPDLNYYIINICNIIDCIDYKTAKKLKWAKNRNNEKVMIGGTFSYVFDADFEYPKIFRLKYNHESVVVNEEMFKILYEKKISGMRFRKIGEKYFVE